VIANGEFVTVTDEPRNGFYPVTYRSTNGWVFGEFLDFTTSAVPITTATVDAAGGLRLRSGPSTGDRVILTMPDSAAVQVTGGSSRGFVSVLYRGRNGWAFAQYLDVAALPPPDPDPEPPVIDSATIVSPNGINLRVGPSTGTATLTTVPTGAAVRVTGAALDGFFPVVFQGTEGWVLAASLQAFGAAALPNPQNVAPTGTARVTVSRLNLRAGPSTRNAVLAVMIRNTTVRVTGSARGGFLPVTYRGVQGWAATQYLAVTLARPSPPPTTPTTPPPTLPPSPTLLAVTDPLNRAPRGSVDRALAYVAQINVARRSDVEAYVREVYAYAPRVGLDPAIVIAQSALETGNWTSVWWRERLNPGGLGITGDPAQNARSRIWANGTESARAQIVHLALYAGLANNPLVQQYRYLDPRYDVAVAAGYTGIARTVNALSGTWAVDPLYAQKVVNRGNSIFVAAR